jgi:hypothetical protein
MSSVSRLQILFKCRNNRHFNLIKIISYYIGTCILFKKQEKITNFHPVCMFFTLKTIQIHNM